MIRASNRSHAIRLYRMATDTGMHVMNKRLAKTGRTRYTYADLEAGSRAFEATIRMFGKRRKK